MKITSVEISPFSDQDPGTPLLVLRTDSPLSGIGEIYVEDRPRPLETMTAALTAMLVGRDPFDLQALSSEVWARPGATPVESAMVAAAGTAMADIAGQDLGVPIHQLLGGRVRDRVRACAVGWADGAAGTADIAAAALRTVAMGFTTLRVEPLAERSARRSTAVANATALVRALRDTLPNEVDIVVDANGAFRTEDAVAFAEALGPLEPLWLERPTPVSRLATLREVADRVTLPLAGGRGTPPDELQSILTEGLIDHVVIEIGRVGGLLEARRIAALAEIYHIGIIPTSTAPVSLATALHLAASVPNLTMIELRPGLAIVENGTVAVDLSPGLGVDSGLATSEMA